MIAASEPQEFVPFGRQQLKNHPRIVHTSDHSHLIDSTLLSRLSKVVITDSCKDKESWILRTSENEGVECEEELFFKDKTVVWSVGPASVENRTNRVLKCCYTSETPVQEALWANFHLSAPDFPSTFYSMTPFKSLRGLPKTIGDAEHLKNCICILNSSVIKCFTPTGREFVTSLQFQVQKLWPIKYGLLIERRVNREHQPPQIPTAKKKSAADLRRQSIEQSFLQKGSINSAAFFNLHSTDPLMPTEPPALDLPTLFTLSHPLDEICPITTKSDYIDSSNLDLKIVFTNENPSLCLTYDRKSGCHAVYLIRKALPHESELCCRRETRPSQQTSFSSVGKKSTASGSFTLETENRSLPAFLSARTRKSLGLGGTTFPNLPPSPYAPFEARTSSPIPSRPFVSSSPFHMTPISRRADSSSSFSGTPGRLETRMMSEDTVTAEAKPLYPQICLQCLWQENQEAKGAEIGVEASKCFLSTDIMGQTYLCYLVHLKLYILRIEIKGDEDFSIVGEPSYLQAKDAAPLESRNMIAVIGLDGGVEVYTGSTHVAKILISGVSSSVATPSYLSDFNSGPTFFSRPSPGAYPKPRYFRRSSLLPQPIPQESPVFNESFSQFSPVTTSSGMSPTLPTSREGTLVALKDNAGGRISLEYSSALLFRLELPNFGNSPLVESITATLTSVLPRPIALQFLIKWYCTRNAPGCYNLCLQEEFLMFSNLLYSSLGYDVEALRGDQLDQSSPVTRPKKLRTSELQSDEDWAVLLESHHHKMAARQIPLGLPALQLRASDFPSICSSSNAETPMITARGSQMHDTSTPVVVEKSKRATKKGAIADCIDSTPMPPKHSSGKGRIPSNRFHKSLHKNPETPVIAMEIQKQAKSTSALRNKKALLHPHFSTILYSLHLLYEDMKLNTLRSRERELLVPILYQLAKDGGCGAYTHHYWTDSPGQCKLVHVPPPRPDIDPVLLELPPSIFSMLNDILLKKADVKPYPYLANVNKRSKDIIEIFGLMSYDTEPHDVILRDLINSPDGSSNSTEFPPSNDPAHRVALHLTNLGITTGTMQTFPAGVVFTIYEALYRCRDAPAHDWDRDTYKLCERHDLASLSRSPLNTTADTTNKLADKRKSNNVPKESNQDEDGMEELGELDTVRLRWAADQRMIELRRMLQSAFPVRISLQQRPEVSDHEFLQEQERHLYAICARTMALPLARGMVTLGCAKPVITEKLPIPQLCLTGKAPPTDKVVEMTHIEVPANMNDWPLFHNGVAAGLKISANAPDIDSQWIIYNKPKTNLEEAIEHAGFLMALGLNGHLKDLTDLTIFMYLVKNHEMTRVGLLLGIAVSKRGTMDAHTVKMVSVHVEAMLPATGIELDVEVIVEPAALMALGFLYQGTRHRHIAQVLLQELGKPPGPEMENSVDRESYSLSAGLALGLVVFGQGNTLSGLADMTIPDTLHHMMVGGPKRAYLGAQRDKYKTASFLTSEGPIVNPHVTGPGATLALGMLYFNTGNKAVAEWLKIPETQHLLETVLPDHLLLRTLAKSLILWDEIDPSEEWVVNHVPAFVRPHCLVKPVNGDDAFSIDYETMNQAYCNIVAGACMAIGLRYAGSAHEEAYETLTYFVVKFTLLLGKSIADLCGRATLETCLNVTTISLGMVMAGTGNLEVMRLCRYLRSRVGPSNSVVTYGSHMATHMTLGLLFLGGGTLTLSTTQDAIAALLCAFYPKWPICSSDNRYHLQALRHLYVLAVQPRLLLPRDIDTRMLCYAHVTYVYLDESIYKGKTVRLLAPCLLPELKLLKEVRIEDDRYWGIRFTEGKSWDELTKILGNSTFVDVKRRAGSQSYIDDPQGFRSLLAQTLTSDDTIPWGVKPPSIYQFSSNPILENFLNIFFDETAEKVQGEGERKTLTAVTDFAYFCLTKDKMCLLPHWLSLIKLSQKLSQQPSAYAIWQWKLVFSQAQSSNYQLIPPDIALSMKQEITSLLTSWEPGVLVQARDYLVGNFESQGLDEGRVTAYLTFHDIPYRGVVDFNRIRLGNMAATLFAMSNSSVSPSVMSLMLSLFEF